MTDPTELDRLDPPPDSASLPSPEEPDEPGSVRQAVLRDLEGLPPELRDSSVAAVALLLARQLDAGGMTPRDASGHAREMRMCLAQLRDWNPGGEEHDATGAARSQVESTRSLYAVPDEESSP